MYPMTKKVGKVEDSNPVCVEIIEENNTIKLSSNLCGQEVYTSAITLSSQINWSNTYQLKSMGGGGRGK